MVDVPADAVDGPVHVGLGQAPGFAYLPDQEQGEEFAVLGEGVEGGRYAGAAFGERDVAPGAVLVEGRPYGLASGRGVEPGRAGEGGAVDGAGGGEGAAVLVPGAGPEVAGPVVRERLGGGGEAAVPGVVPGGSWLEGEGGGGGGAGGGR